MIVDCCLKLAEYIKVPSILTASRRRHGNLDFDPPQLDETNMPELC